LAQPLGKIELPVTFGTADNFRTEKILFDVADTNLPYNGILGRPALAQFMVASHYAYLVAKIPGPNGPITVKADVKAAVLCAERANEMAAADVPDHDRPDHSGAPRGKAKTGASTSAPTKEMVVEKARLELAAMEEDYDGPKTSGAAKPKPRIRTDEKVHVKEVRLGADPTKYIKVGTTITPK
jgi:hypothetical protein